MSGQRGRPVLGAIAGLLFGLALATDLLLLGSIALDSALVVLLPIIFLVLGIAAGIFAPLRFLRR
jgi:hypothetical protein